MTGTARTVGNVIKVAAVRGTGILLSLLVWVLVASRFGASAQSDAFFFSRNVVMELAEAVRRVILVNAVPGFVVAQRAGPAAWRRQLIGTLLFAFGIGAGLALVPIFFSDRVVAWLAVGFDGERAAIAARLLSILGLMFPAVLAVAVIGGALNARRRFGNAELSMILPRVALVLALIVLVPLAGVTTLAWAMVAGIITGLAVLILSLRKVTAVETDPQPASQRNAPTGGGDRLLAIVLIQAYVQLSLWIDYRFLSSFAEGSLSVVEYGQRLMQILPGVVSASITTVVYTEIAARQSERDALPGRISRITISGYFVVLPITVTLALLAPRAVELLLGHGRFDAEAVEMTARMMRLYAPTVSLGLISNLVFLAVLADQTIRRTRLLLPVLFAALLLRYFGLSWLTAAIGLPAIPVTAGVVSLAVSIAVLVAVRDLGAAFTLRVFWSGMIRLGVACTATVLVIAGPAMFDLWPAPTSILWQAALLVALGALALAVYGGVALALGVKDAAQLLDTVQRRFWRRRAG